MFLLGFRHPFILNDRQTGIKLHSVLKRLWKVLKGKNITMWSGDNRGPNVKTWSLQCRKKNKKKFTYSKKNLKIVILRISYLFSDAIIIQSIYRISENISEEDLWITTINLTLLSYWRVISMFVSKHRQRRAVHAPYIHVNVSLYSHVNIYSILYVSS